MDCARNPELFGRATVTKLVFFTFDADDLMRESVHVKDIRATTPATHFQASRASRRGRIEKVQHGTAEPPSVALLRHVLNPAVIILTLLMCVLAYGQPLEPHYLALAALAFLISAQVVSDPVLDSSGRNGVSTLLNHRIFTEWLLVSCHVASIRLSSLIQRSRSGSHRYVEFALRH